MTDLAVEDEDIPDTARKPEGEETGEDTPKKPKKAANAKKAKKAEAEDGEDEAEKPKRGSRKAKAEPVSDEEEDVKPKKGGRKSKALTSDDEGEEVDVKPKKQSKKAKPAAEPVRRTSAQKKVSISHSLLEVSTKLRYARESQSPKSPKRKRQTTALYLTRMSSRRRRPESRPSPPR